MTLSIDTLTERDVAKTIDHSLLRPELDDAFVDEGCRLAAEYHVARVCCRPVDVPRAAAILRGVDLRIAPGDGEPGKTGGGPHAGPPLAVRFDPDDSAGGVLRS